MSYLHLTSEERYVISHLVLYGLSFIRQSAGKSNEIDRRMQMTLFIGMKPLKRMRIRENVCRIILLENLPLS